VVAAVALSSGGSAGTWNNTPSVQAAMVRR
jgi:hypothetical protein